MTPALSARIPQRLHAAAVSRKRQFFLGLFLGLLTFAIYFSLQTLKESVISDVAPFLLLSSYFAPLYIYLSFPSCSTSSTLFPTTST
jgi:hypothetical protein